MKVVVLKRSDDAYYFASGPNLYEAKYHGGPERTFLSPARFVEGTNDLERTYGGVMVFTGHVGPQLMYEIVTMRDGAIRQGNGAGAEAARREIREALGI